jgi:hypothetical protein
LTTNGPNNAPERLGDRPGFEKWADDLVSVLETRRRGRNEAANDEPDDRHSRIGRAWRVVAKTVRLA